MTAASTTTLYGAWPIRMNAEDAARFVGERSAAEFRKRVATGEYPAPVINDGRGKSRRVLWLRRDLEAAVNGAMTEVEVA